MSKDLYHSFKVWWRSKYNNLFFSEELDQREGLLYDAFVKGFDSNFWKGDTANLLNDSVRDAVKIGDTGLVGKASSYSQYLYGDFEFALLLDSTTPDSNDSGRYVGLRNMGDTLNRGAAFFDFTYDTTAGDSSDTTRPFSFVVYGENGTRYRRFGQWDTDWSGGARLARFRISWEPNGYKFLVNDTLEASISEGQDSNGAEVLINTSIPQALRIHKMSTDTTDTNCMAMKFVNIRNARKII